MPTDTGVSVPSGWKLQDTEVCVPVVLVDLNLHDSFPWVPFATKISFGVYTSKAATPAVSSPSAASTGHSQRLRPGAALPAPAPAGAAIVLALRPPRPWASPPRSSGLAAPAAASPRRLPRAPLPARPLARLRPLRTRLEVPPVHQPASAGGAPPPRSHPGASSRR